MKIGPKLLIAFLAVGLLSAAAMGWQAYRDAREALRAEASMRLVALREVKRRQVERYFSQVRDQLLTLAESPGLIEAAGELGEAYRRVGEGSTPKRTVALRERAREHYRVDYLRRLSAVGASLLPLEHYLPSTPVALELQRRYIIDSPHREGAREALTQASVGDAYDIAHARFHPALSSFQRRFGFHDLFLADVEGNLIYSTMKEEDFATSLITGPYRDSGLARAFFAARNIPAIAGAAVKLEEYARYLPSGDAPASFMATPVFDAGRKVAVLLFQMPVDRINEVMTGDGRWEEEGLGASGETLLVGEDYTLRSDARALLQAPKRHLRELAAGGVSSEVVDAIHLHRTSILYQPLKAEVVRAALRGERGLGRITDHRGVALLAAYAPIEVQGVRWALLSLIEEREAFASAEAMIGDFMRIGAALFVLVALFSLALARRFTAPIERLAEAAERLERGGMVAELPREGRDEIGDLSERFNRMAASLHRTTVSRRYLDDLLASLVDGVITIDTAGHIRSTNPAVETIFGFTAEEMIGNNVKMLMPEPYHGAHDGYLEHYLTTGERRIIGIGREVEGQRKGGERFPLDLAVSETLLGEERLFVGVVRDISERKRMERMKNEFVSTVSHELRTPLTSIHGSLGLVRGGVGGALPEKSAELVEVAHRNSERLVSLINDILDIEKIEAGKMAFQLERLDLARLVDRAVEENHGFAERHRVDLVVSEGPPEQRVAIPVWVDADRFAQVMANLISNACKFSPPLGRVTVSVELSEAGARVSVNDRGDGIPEAFQPRLFEKFSQADASDTRRAGGTGLGLSICKAIVERMGGTIGFDTESGRGTTLYFTLPLADEQNR